MDVARSARPDRTKMARKREAAWLGALLLLLVVLLLAAVVAPILAPVELQAGRYVVRVTFLYLPEPGAPFIHTSTGEMWGRKSRWWFPDGRRPYQVAYEGYGGIHEVRQRIGSLTYQLQWFRGHRIPVPRNFGNR